ncbi:Fumarate reductase flavoprotein subunit [Streptomyces sp. MBT84]|uniref:FAD-binding protein n=1 Tax=Streptomyces sp. MBT84 TaxID=1488414 RepID=UPI001C6E619D|nr:FAD-binding protein [Streptomyces sp. MBT84]MBW8699124.1 Fumarate reductase flavoprotein subunit [Streptomyces sp. MBT84]
MSSLGHQLATSVLVVGTGGSGLRAAIEVAEAGVAVIAVAKDAADGVHTVMASGSIEWPSVADTGDTWERHAADTLREGRLLADPRAAQIVAHHAVRGFHDAERYGVRLERRGHGGSAERRFSDQTYHRTAFANEYTGPEVRQALRERVRQLAIPVLPSVYVTRLLVDDGTVFGAYGFDLVDGSRYLVHADSVILAAGGHTRIWRRTSSRRDENTGDAFRLAVEAGARLRDPELVQFHPFGLIRPENAADVLVSEAARGEGGVLLNNLGERFMARYDAERMELCSRERVAMASCIEIKEGRGTRAGGVWLDLSHLPRERVLSRLPQVHQTLWDLQMLDITRDPIEVAPTAQYAMGGVWVRPEDHSTDVDGLFVIGEAASGLHGASRVEENSLIELLVYGRIAGRTAAEYSAGLSSLRRSPAAVRAAEADVDRLLAADGDQNVRALLRSVRHLMTERAGVVRDETGLSAGLVELDEIEARVGAIGVHIDIGGFPDLAYAYELRSAVLAARATLECALERRETRGCHNRSDYPEADSELAVNLVWSPATGVRPEPVPPIPTAIAELMEGISADAGSLEQGAALQTPLSERE